MFDVTVLRHVRRGRVVQFGANELIHRIAFPEVGIGALAKSAVAACTGFFVLRLTMKAVHEGGFLQR
jgi:hypothetical protein